MEYSRVREVIDGVVFNYRLGSSDRKIIELVHSQNSYRLAEDMQGAVVVDIGAQVGAFTLLAASRGATVYAFEPYSESFKLLEKNVAENHFKKVHIFQKAVGIKGVCRMFVHPTNTGSNSLYFLDQDYQEEQCEAVEVITLNEVFSQNKISHCDFLKLDCEGAEIEIFPEIIRGLYSKIDVISGELHSAMSKTPTPHQDAIIKGQVVELRDRYFETALSQAEYIWVRKDVKSPQTLEQAV